jgi:hypothetical protein
MDETNAGNAPEEEARHWTMETLPMSVRKELLERELKKLGLRKSGSHGHDGAMAQQHSQPRGGEHPQADAGEGHSD